MAKAQVQATPVEAGMGQLATRIPTALHKALKLHCVANSVSVMEFVTAAIEEKLAAETQPQRKGKARK